MSDRKLQLYSAMFTSFSHPNLMRSVFIDGQSFRAIDFMSNVVCLAVRIRNAGLSDHGLMIQLSEALAGALSGSGHSVLYDDPQPYLQSIRCFFETDVPPAFVNEASEPIYEPHNGRAPTNPYVLPVCAAFTNESSASLALIPDCGSGLCAACLKTSRSRSCSQRRLQSCESSLRSGSLRQSGWWTSSFA